MRSTTVGDLKEYLEQYDEDANVLIIWQEHWPFESHIRGVLQRSDFEEIDDEDSEMGDGVSPLKKTNDVIIVMGEQIRYGSREAWNAC